MIQDYTKYKFTPPEFIGCLLEAIILCLIIDYLFYKNLWFLLIIVPVVPLYIRLKRKAKLAQLKKRLNYDFKDALNGLSVAFRAGYSTENAFIEAEKYLCDTIGKENILTKEFAYINRKVKMNVPIEGLINDFARRCNIEDITNFAAVFTSAKRMGGNMAGIIASTASQIEGKIDVEREVDTALAAKKLEQRIMAVMPFAIIFYIQITSPDFISCLYGTTLGIITMTGCLLVYAGAFALGNKIVAIEV